MEREILAIETGFSKSLDKGQLYIKASSEPLVVQYDTEEEIADILATVMRICEDERTTYLKLMVCKDDIDLLNKVLKPYIGDAPILSL